MSGLHLPIARPRSTFLLAAILSIFVQAYAVASPAPVRPSQPSCSAQWRAHGHTTQAEAKAFAKICLKKQGAVEQQLDIKSVTQKLTAVLRADNPLTALVPADIATFCPGYRQQGREGRAVFWRTVLAVIAGRESAYNTAAAYWEENQHQYSLGLLQLSLADEGSYRCGFTSEADIADPNRHLTCGAKVMTKLVAKHGVVGGDPAHFSKGGGAYWSTLRHTSNARAKVIEATRALAVCRP